MEKLGTRSLTLPQLAAATAVEHRFSDQRDPANRKVTYGLCYYDDHGAGPTTVTLDITDPDESIRSSTHDLAGDKDSVLVGSSPPGPGGYVPPDGWCD